MVVCSIVKHLRCFAWWEGTLSYTRLRLMLITFDPSGIVRSLFIAQNPEMVEYELTEEKSKKL